MKDDTNAVKPVNDDLEQLFDDIGDQIYEASEADEIDFELIDSYFENARKVCNSFDKWLDLTFSLSEVHVDDLVVKKCFNMLVELAQTAENWREAYYAAVDDYDRKIAFDKVTLNDFNTARWIDFIENCQKLMEWRYPDPDELFVAVLEKTINSISTVVDGFIACNYLHDYEDQVLVGKIFDKMLMLATGASDLELIWKYLDSSTTPVDPEKFNMSREYVEALHESPYPYFHVDIDFVENCKKKTLLRALDFLDNSPEKEFIASKI